MSQSNKLPIANLSFDEIMHYGLQGNIELTTAEDFAVFASKIGTIEERSYQAGVADVRGGCLDAEY